MCLMAFQLPIPQLVSNYKRKSLQGFRLTVLAGWLFGDAFKTLYFFFQAGNTWQFKATACFQLSVDFLILLQAYSYRHNRVTCLATHALKSPDHSLQIAMSETQPLKDEENVNEGVALHPQTSTEVT